MLFIYPDAISFRQTENEEKFHAITIKVATKQRECVTCGEQLQIGLFTFIQIHHTTFRKLCLSDNTGKINESSTVREQAIAVRAPRAPKGLSIIDQHRLGPHFSLWPRSHAKAQSGAFDPCPRDCPRIGAVLWVACFLDGPHQVHSSPVLQPCLRLHLPLLLAPGPGPGSSLASCGVGDRPWPQQSDPRLCVPSWGGCCLCGIAQTAMQKIQSIPLFSPPFLSPFLHHFTKPHTHWDGSFFDNNTR